MKIILPILLVIVAQASTAFLTEKEAKTKGIALPDGYTQIQMPPGINKLPLRSPDEYTCQMTDRNRTHVGSCNQSYDLDWPLNIKIEPN